MTYVITEPCIDVMDKSCVEVCPVDCIHTGDEGEDRMLYIDPDECIDCGACEPACPVTAIFTEDDVPDNWKEYTASQRPVVQGQGRRAGEGERAEAGVRTQNPEPRT